MAVTTTADPVASQYERWIYPRPVEDLSVAQERHLRAGCDPARLSAAYWPDRPPRAAMKILVAGCGANLAARYAFHYPESHVVGIDISAASLAHERHLKEKHSLSNLELRLGRLEDVARQDESFDFIDTSGVLHHLPDPAQGLRALGSALAPDGVIFVMLYAKYGRTGVYMLQDLFRMMELEQGEQDLAAVKACLSTLKPDHQIQRYLRQSNDVDYDAGLVDTFLHRQDIPFTVRDCLRLTEDAGLAFQGWMENFFYYPEAQIPRTAPFYAYLDALPERLRWQAMELMHGYVSQHAFFVCHADRDPATYRITFEADEFMRYIPVPRWDLAVRDAPDGLLVLERAPYPPLPLSRPQSLILRQVDGRRCIEDCVRQAGFKDPPDVALRFCRSLFQDLWRLGLYDYRLPQSIADDTVPRKRQMDWGALIEGKPLSIQPGQ
ncbi:MAG: class I SAM-dependent methyltransferase [Gammaproteobacteria bacterium]|nr:class I SAM-dependent methyltransferase [Gammaproteobacteria bacterium]